MRGPKRNVNALVVEFRPGRVKVADEVQKAKVLVKGKVAILPAREVICHSTVAYHLCVVKDLLHQTVWNITKSILKPSVHLKQEVK